MNDWIADVRAYAPDADAEAVGAIAMYLGIAMQNRDASLVSFSSKAELETVRESFLKRKLGLTNPDAELDAAIAEVGERMKNATHKNRVTVYYLLAEHFGKVPAFA